eukprot:6486014-Amphidinium_carterae.3
MAEREQVGLSKAWENHHLLSEPLPAIVLPLAQGKKDTICLQVGTCLCSPSGRMLAKMHKKVINWTHEANLQGADCKECIVRRDMGQQSYWFGVAMMYFSPYRPTLEKLQQLCCPEPVVRTAASQKIYMQMLDTQPDALHFWPPAMPKRSKAVSSSLDIAWDLYASNAVLGQDEGAEDRFAQDSGDEELEQEQANQDDEEDEEESDDNSELDALEALLTRSGVRGPRSSGRPLGLLMAWLSLDAEAATHCDKGFLRDVLTLQVRTDARQELQHYDGSANLLAREREIDPGEESEPVSLKGLL